MNDRVLLLCLTVGLLVVLAVSLGCQCYLQMAEQAKSRITIKHEELGIAQFEQLAKLLT
jgi:hypothetical protein